jgi:ribonuclease HI
MPRLAPAVTATFLLACDMLGTMPTTVYTAGACVPNPGPGGWAWAIRDGPYASGFDPATTDQRMELSAALQAVRSNPGPLRVISDSTYVVKLIP